MAEPRFLKSCMVWPPGAFELQASSVSVRECYIEILPTVGRRYLLIKRFSIFSLEDYQV